jgi:hypothetical protein
MHSAAWVQHSRHRQRCDAARGMRSLVWHSTGFADGTLASLAQAGDQVRGGVAVLHIGRGDDHPDGQADCVGQDMSLAALDHLFRRIKPRGPPDARNWHRVPCNTVAVVGKIWLC